MQEYEASAQMLQQTRGRPCAHHKAGCVVGNGALFAETALLLVVLKKLADWIRFLRLSYSVVQNVETLVVFDKVLVDIATGLRIESTTETGMCYILSLHE